MGLAAGAQATQRASPTVPQACCAAQLSRRLTHMASAPSAFVAPTAPPGSAQQPAVRLTIMSATGLVWQSHLARPAELVASSLAAGVLGALNHPLAGLELVPEPWPEVLARTMPSGWALLKAEVDTANAHGDDNGGEHGVVNHGGDGD